MFRTTFDAENKLWSGAKVPPIFNPKTSLGNVILSALQANGSRIAQICAKTNVSTTFSELYDQTICVANNLKKRGFQKGEVIFFFASNSTHTAALVFGALVLGCPVSSANKNCSERELIHHFKTTEPKYVFCGLKYYDMLHECTENLNFKPIFFTFGGQKGDSLAIKDLFEKCDSDFCFIPAEVDGVKDISFIGRSSGTTGMPKGIPMPHASIFDTMRRMASVIKASDVVLVFAGVSAISGIRALVSATLNGSTRIVNQGRFSPEIFFELVERFKVSFVHSGVYSVHRILNHPQIETADLSSLKQYLCSGTKVSLDVIHKMNEYLGNGKFCNAYGITETFGLIAINLDHQRNNCAGQLISGCDAKVVNDRGERLGIGEDGELCVKQLYPIPGYLVCDEGTQSICFDNEGFFITGDIARFDENGDLFIVDRKKEIFKCGGVKITPAEIEEFLNKLDGVKQSCLVPIPDATYDLVPAAVIVKSHDSTCTENFIFDAVSNNFSIHKQLKGGVYFVQSLPLIGMGKIARRLVTQTAIELQMSRKNSEETT